MASKAFVGIAFACAVVGASLFLLLGERNERASTVAETVMRSDDESAAPESPFAVANAPPDPVSPREIIDRETAAGRGGSSGSDLPTTDGAGSSVDPVDVFRLGREPMSDEEFEVLVARLGGDPDLLATLIEELRGETDAARIERLSLLLGDLEHPDVTALAVELAYSADPALRDAGLDLLKRTGDGDLAERDAVVSGMLSTETDARVLMSALGAIARPGNVDEARRASMATQVALLAAHEDPAVRRGSIEVVSRWTRDGSDTPVLLAGLKDSEASVRRGAAYALVGHEAIDDDVRRELRDVVEDESEARETRSAALLALRRAGTSDDEAARAELDRLQRQLDRQARDDRAG